MSRVQNFYLNGIGPTLSTGPQQIISGKELQINVISDASGTFGADLLGANDDVILNPVLGINKINVEERIRTALDSDIRRMNFTFTTLNDQAVPVNVSLTAVGLNTKDMVTLHDAGGRPLKSTDGALNVNLTTGGLDFVDGVLPVSITNAAIDVDVCVNDIVTVYGSTGMPVAMDGSGKLQVVIDNNTIDVDVSITDSITTYGSEGLPLRTDASGRVLVSSGITTQKDYLDISQGNLVNSGRTKLESLSAVNMRNDTVLFLKLYNKGTAPTTSDTPTATYALFPQRREHFNWVHGLDFASGLGLMCTLGRQSTDGSFASPNDCMAHLSYV